MRVRGGSARSALTTSRGKCPSPAAALIDRHGVDGFTGGMWSIDPPCFSVGVGPNQERSFLRSYHYYYLITGIN